MQRNCMIHKIASKIKLACLLLLLGSNTTTTFSQRISQHEKIYILFKERESPRAYYYSYDSSNMYNKGAFILINTSGDCPYSAFTFDKSRMHNPTVQVKVDTLMYVLQSSWIATQKDSVLLEMFHNKELYVIPVKDLKNNIGNAHQVLFRPCEIE